ncbi:thiol:disulfide interchange protein DsbA/DsbL [Pleionea sediminis]|uniref:thiol:disulfide interchange protein DsbA/DsbL n=1 Tax=Pleionea sediminis TaxID=2569479 RepID=UPI0013DD9CE4|nr:thiol:disulfide interchange protein DsbA/DsbL [Pleionea sediminis]
MRIITTLFLTLVLLGCNNEPSQSEEASKNEDQTAQPAETKTSTEAKTESHDGHDGHNHQHDSHVHESTSGPLISAGYSEVEVKDRCETPTVIEFFAYQCPHCYKLEEHVKEWEKNKSDDVQFITVPSDLGREQFTVFVVSHYIAERLNVLDKVKPQLFAIIHENKPINNILEVFTAAGIPEEEAKKAFEDSETIRKDLVKGFELSKNYKITGVPKILVNYQYTVDVTSAGGYEKVFEVVEDTLKLSAKCKTFTASDS